jgi:hypothetical protein
MKPWRSWSACVLTPMHRCGPTLMPPTATPSGTPTPSAARWSSTLETSSCSPPPTYHCLSLLPVSWLPNGWGPSGSWHASELWPTGCSFPPICTAYTLCFTWGFSSLSQGRCRRHVSPSSLLKVGRKNSKSKLSTPTVLQDVVRSTWCGGRATLSGKPRGSRKIISPVAPSCSAATRERMGSEDSCWGAEGRQEELGRR